MMNTKTTKRQQAIILVSAFGAGVVALVILALVLYNYGPGNMWLGAIGGGTVTLLALAVATWRVLRRPDSSNLVDRTIAVGAARDERDQAILRNAFAILGYFALPLTMVAAVALAIGAPLLPTITILLFSQIATGVGGFIYQARRI